MSLEARLLSPTEEDPLGIRLRLEEMKLLEDGWADGMQEADNRASGQGVAFQPSELDWLADRFASQYAPGLPQPYLYPMPDGGVQVEWSMPPNEASLEIRFSSRSAEWHCLDLETGLSSERMLRLDQAEAWAWLTEELRRLERTAQ